MFEKKKRIAITSIGIIYAIVLIALGVLFLITKSFLVSAFLHTCLRVFLIPVILKVLQKSFKELKNNKGLIICGIIITIDFVILDFIRYILTNGVSLALFFPACIPICFMIIMHYTFKNYEKRDKRIIYVVGVPLLILSLYFEVLSFIQI